MENFFHMDGYAAYIWPAFAVVLLGLGLLAYQSWADMKKSQDEALKLKSLRDKEMGR